MTIEAQIVNLSITHNLETNLSLSAFTQLCNNYSQGILCRGPWTPTTNSAWVKVKHLWHMSGFLKDYNLGRISTDDFLDKFLNDICYFMNAADFKPTEEDKERIDGIRNILLSLQGKEALTGRDYARALIEEAYCALIDFDEPKRLTVIMGSETPNKPTYLVSNSNEINLHKITLGLKQANPAINWHEVPIQHNKGVVEVAPNLFLYTSNVVHALKSESDKHQPHDGTPTLLRNLVGILDENGIAPDQIEVVSQFGKDLEEAELKCGIPHDNCRGVNRLLVASMF